VSEGSVAVAFTVLICFASAQLAQDASPAGFPGGFRGMSDDASSPNVADDPENLFDSIKPMITESGITAEAAGPPAFQNTWANTAYRPQTSKNMYEGVAKAGLKDRNIEGMNSAYGRQSETTQRVPLRTRRDSKPSVVGLHREKIIPTEKGASRAFSTMLRAQKGVPVVSPTTLGSKSQTQKKTNVRNKNPDDPEFDKIEAQLKAAEKLT